jgi:hypothetical protein
MSRVTNVTRVAAALGAAAALSWAAPASAQSADPNPGAMTLTANFDVVNAYMFRGIPQDESRVIMWPSADLGIALFSGDGGLKSVGVNIGTWNSLHTGDAGLKNLVNGKMWYESDFYATVGFGLSGGLAAGVTYTAYTSPNGLFGTVKEIAFKLSVDDSGRLGAAAVRPYVLLARELSGQADGGAEEGTYVEIGVAPGVTLSRVSVSVPVKVGLSAGNYYEGLNGDETFGYVSIAGIATVPLTSMPTRFGTWNVHGGVEYQRLGDRNSFAFGENQAIYSVGVGFSY